MPSGGVRVPEADDPAVPFDLWVAPHLSVMHRLAARLSTSMDAEDIVQDALVRAWKRRHTYNPALGSEAGWLLAIVKDQARRRRSRARAATVELHAEAAIIDQVQDVDLARAVTLLGPRQRLAIDLYYYVGLDIRTCAELMQCAEGTVRATLHQSRLRLHDLLAEEPAHD